MRFDNDATHRATVIEVHAGDGVGVLHRITRALAELDLDIRSAKVQTLGTRWSTPLRPRRNGEKIADADHQAERSAGRSCTASGSRGAAGGGRLDRPPRAAARGRR